MSYAIGRSLRPMWRWISYRPPLHFSMRRDRMLGLRGTSAYYAQRRTSEIILFLKRYRRNGATKWVNASSFESREPLDLRISTANEDHPSSWNVANAVTIGRIAVTPLIGSWIISGHYKLALTGLMYAAVSDALDGILARRLNLRTILGSYLDPAADKLLISTTCICLAVKGVIPSGLAALIIGRDLGLIGGWLWHSRGRTMTSNTSGVLGINHLEPLFISKLNTSLQISLGFTGVLHATDCGVVSEEVLQAIECATALTTVASGASYANKFWKTSGG